MSSLDLRAVSDKELKQKPFPSVKQEFRVLVDEAAFDHAVARGEADTTREIGGILVGELLRDEAGPYLRVDATIDALHAEEKGAELTFTHATWEHIHKEMDSKHAGKKVVGWYHTHPGFGIFLSDRDQFIHRSFFNLPFQVALVYDPKTREHGIFGWRDNEPWRLRRYWVGPREHSWDGARPVGSDGKLGGRKSGQMDAVKPPVATAAPAPSSGEEKGADWLTLGGLALVAMLVAGIVGWWLGTRAAADAIREAESQIAHAQADGARQAVASLDAELVGLLRSTLGDEALKRPAQQILDDTDAALKELGAPSDAKGQAIVARLKDARSVADHLRNERAGAEAVLSQLEQAARRGVGQNPAAQMDLARDLAFQRAAVGQLYADRAEDAVRANDPQRARRYLTVAANVDPGNYGHYQQQLASFDKSAPLPPPSTARALLVNDATPPSDGKTDGKTDVKTDAKTDVKTDVKTEPKAGEKR